MLLFGWLPQLQRTHKLLEGAPHSALLRGLSRPLLQHEAELSNKAREGKGAVGIDTVHVLQDALLLFLQAAICCIMLSGFMLHPPKDGFESL